MGWTITVNPIPLDVCPPVSQKQLTRIDKSAGYVQFDQALSNRDHEKLAARLRGFPRICLRAYQLWGSPEVDLNFLQHYRGLKRLWIDLPDLHSFDGSLHLADSLEYPHLGATNDK